MEESFTVSPKFKELQTKFGQSISLHQPKSITKSKIKRMQGRIFWTRNNFESSLERIVTKEKENSPDKFVQYKKTNSMAKEELEEIVKKLSLPKVKDSLMSKARNHSFGMKENKNEKLKVSESIHQLREVNKREKKEGIENSKNLINKILEKFNRRINEEIEEFSFCNISTHESKKTFKKQKKVNKQPEHVEQSSYLPKEMLKCLTKNLR